jgi:hypothetical protein
VSNYFRIQWLNVGRFQVLAQEYSMGAVMIKCPETGRPIPTGIVADRDSFSATPVFFPNVHCPICETEHEWFVGVRIRGLVRSPPGRAWSWLTFSMPWMTSPHTVYSRLSQGDSSKQMKNWLSRKTRVHMISGAFSGRFGFYTGMAST